MPSPFPGMDPYLEDLTHWSDVHASLIYAFRVQLSRQMPPGFRASIETDLMIQDSGRRMRPDVFLTTEPTSPVKPTRGLAVLEKVQEVGEISPFLDLRYFADSVRQRFIQITRINKPGDVITIIEILSPANKTPGDNYADYIRKQELLLAAPLNFIEVDLQRAGRHTIAAPTHEILTPAPYYVCLHRAEAADPTQDGIHFQVWPIQMRERLPIVAVPLTAEFPDARLDLQAALNQIYEDGDYEGMVDYSREPTPPLSPEDATWADALLHEKGLR